MSLHTATPARKQVWLDNHEPLPDDLMRLVVTDCTGRVYRTLAQWDGEGFTMRCPLCGTYVEPPRLAG
jgi:hypothetical protein